MTSTTNPPDDYPSHTGTNVVIPINSSIKGAIEAYGDQDFWLVSLQAGTTYLVSATGKAGGGGTLDFAATGYSLNLSYKGLPADFLRNVDASLIMNGGPGGDPMFSVTPEYSGYYYLYLVGAGYSGTGTYTVTATVAPTKDDFTASTSTTGSLSAGGQVIGSLEQIGDVDWIRMNVVGGMRYTISAPDSEGQSLNFDLRSSSNQQLAWGSSDGAGGKTLSFVASTSEPMYLTVSDALRKTRSYSISAVENGRVDDYSADPSTLGTLAIGGQLGGKFEVANDVDWIRVDLQSGTNYVFGVSGSSSLQLYNSISPYYLADASGVVNEPVFVFSPTTSGDYYLRVAGGTHAGSAYTERRHWSDTVSPSLPRW